LNNKHIACVVVAIAMATGFLSGCASTQTATAGQSQEAFSKSMADADQVAGTSDKDGSIRMYQKIATDNPSRAEPWSRISQIRFAQGSYSLAIVAAEETLKRDPSNRQAKSVTVVGGLRLATRSLEDLRKDSSLTGDTTADARRLAALLRETLGTSVLVPAESPRPRPRPRPAPAAASESAPASAPAAPAPTAPARASGGGGNPFDALK
jgi:hypothetical protein